MKSTCTFLTLFLVLVLHIFVPVQLQSVQSRHYRPSPSKCDRYGRCSPKEGYIEEIDHDDDYKSQKDRPPELTRDDWPVRPLDDDLDRRRVDDKDDKVKPTPGRPVSTGGYSGGYNTKPTIDKDDEKVSGGRPGGVYNPKPAVRDDDLKPSGGGRPSSGGGRPSSGGYGGGYNPKPPIDRDDDLKPAVRPGNGGYGGGSYKPVDRDDDIKPPVGRPGGGTGAYGGGYNPKPVDRDDDIKPVVRPSGGSGGYGGGYNPKPVDRDDYNPKPVDRDDYNPKPVDRDDYNPKPVDRGDYNPIPAGTRGGYVPKAGDDDYDIKPARGGGGYYPEDDRKTSKDDLGGFGGGSKDDDYNDGYDTKGVGVEDDDYYGKPVPVVDGNCICVPYYQCTDGHIVTDGAGIIDARKRPDPNEELPLDGKFKPPSCGPYHVCCNTPESSTVKPYEHRCGVRNPSGINSRILSPSNKGEADFGEWPWQAAVLKAEGKVNIFQCGGVLIDKYHVITVAHCVFHLYQFNEYPLKVRLGEWDTQTTTEFLAHEDYRVSKIIIHPEYRNTSLWNDIAILRLQDPVLFAPHIDTVCLPQYDEIFSDQNCVVTGWGKDAYKGGTFSNVMKEVALQVIDNYKCEEMLRKTRLGRFFQLYEGFLCAGGEYGLDSCKGDGGGPLVCYRKDKSYALAGIVSWGIDCGQPGVPGVYVKIQKYVDWISKTTGVTLQEYWPKRN